MAIIVLAVATVVVMLLPSPAHEWVVAAASGVGAIMGTIAVLIAPEHERNAWDSVFVAALIFVCAGFFADAMWGSSTLSWTFIGLGVGCAIVGNLMRVMDIGHAMR